MSYIEYSSVRDEPGPSRHPGESRDPPCRHRGGGQMDPGFRRDDGMACDLPCSLLSYPGIGRCPARPSPAMNSWTSFSLSRAAMAGGGGSSVKKASSSARLPSRTIGLRPHLLS